MLPLPPLLCSRRCCRPAASLPNAATANAVAALPPPLPCCHCCPCAANAFTTLSAIAALLPHCLPRSADAATALPMLLQRFCRCCRAATTTTALLPPCCHPVALHPCCTVAVLLPPLSLLPLHWHRLCHAACRCFAAAALPPLLCQCCHRAPAANTRLQMPSPRCLLLLRCCRAASANAATTLSTPPSPPQPPNLTQSPPLWN